jgi:SsrA-binding protein
MNKVEEKHIIDIKNKKASFLYFLLQEYTAGIVLVGSEVKSIREGKANLNDAYCTFLSGELWVNQMHIAEYRFASYGKFNLKRDRKLLLTKKELRKLEAKSKEKGFTIVPTLLYIDERGYAKMKICLARGKHSYDKRDSIKDRENKRELNRINKKRY